VKKMYERASRACDLVGMTPELADAIQAWAEKYERTLWLAEAIAGCETASKPLARGLSGLLRGSPKPQLCAVLLGPRWLLWATKIGDDQPFVVSVQLPGAELTDYRKRPEYDVMPDDGLDVFGHVGFSSERGTVFLGLGDDSDGRAFKKKVLATWRAVRE
jgi:hypothetical protein